MPSFSPEDEQRIFDRARKITGTCDGDNHEHTVILSNVKRRMNIRRITSLDKYLAIIEKDRHEREHFISALTIHTTSWFRELPHFELIESIIRKQIAQGKQRFRMLSAACSTGQEPYSFALLFEYIKSTNPNWDYSIVASDIDPISVAKAKRALYPADFLKEIPSQFRRPIMIGCDRMLGQLTLSKNILTRIEFHTANLLELHNHAKICASKYDLIVCRNVFIYFTPEQIQTICATFRKLTSPGGHLCLGHSESITGQCPGFESLGNSLYHDLSQSKKSSGRSKGRGKILVIDDSKITQSLVEGILVRAGYDTVVANSIAEANAQVKNEIFQLITLDLSLPDGNGANWLAKQRNGGLKTPIIVLSGSSKSEAQAVFNALEHGAQDYFDKNQLKRDEFLQRIRAWENTEIAIEAKPLSLPKTSRQTPNQRPDLVLIGASTGGTGLLVDLLKDLPRTFPPLVVIQHITSEFSLAFSERLATASGLKLIDPRSSPQLLPGHLYMAVDDYHLSIVQDNSKLLIKPNYDAPVSRHRPSIDTLFQSAARTSGFHFHCYLLTGMGSDGVQGMLELHKKGHLTYAQDQESCAVFGMPREAIRLGAVDVVAGPREIRNSLLRLELLPKNQGRSL